MATSPTTSQLRSQIIYHLDTDLLETANFLAGRLHALEPRSADAAHLLALTFHRLRRYKAAADSAHKFGANGRHLGCAYVFAQACLQLGRHTEGAGGLEKCKLQWSQRNQWSSNSEGKRKERFLPDAPAVSCLLGKLYHAHGDLKKAGDYYVEAHKGNPFLWEAFDGLCKVGADLNVGNMFRVTNEMAGLGSTSVAPAKEASASTGDIYTDEPPTMTLTQPLAPQLNFNQQVFTPSADPFQTSKIDPSEPFALPPPNNIKGKASKAISEWDTPTTTIIAAEDEDVLMNGVLLELETTAAQPPAAPARRTKPGQFEASDRPRPPALRGHLPSASEGHNDDAVMPRRKPSAAMGGGHKRTISGQQPPSTSATSDPSQQAPPRRSNRLFGQSTTSSRQTVSSRPTTAESGTSTGPGRPAKTATGTKGRIGSTVGRVVSGNRKVLPPDRNNHKDEKEGINARRAPSRNAGVTTAANTEKPILTQQKTAAAPTTTTIAIARDEHDSPPADLEAVQSLLDSLRTLATGTYATTRFDTALAIKTFRSLPSSQRETPFVLAQLGKAHYEAGAYVESEECFARCLKLQPSRTQGMEVYSTVLWHLKRDAALAFLCHLLRDIDSNAPETWVAVGNAFSLAREHDQAIAAFRRAVLVDEKFAYAWTLMGHEYIANEDFDAALSCFRHAVAGDRRGYGGWYGLGKCFERLGKLEDAESHYRIASSINPASSTLLVCVGVILEKQRNRRGALANYTKALELSPSSALARFKKARVLMHLRHFSEALVELEVLREQAPEEANVWFLLGKCYKGLGERGEALGALTRALNLDVKVSRTWSGCVVS